MSIYEFDGFRPVVHESAFVHPLAAVIGNVIIGRNVFVGASATMRGDWGMIIAEDGSNVQESCVVHVFPGATVVLHRGAHLGHGAIVHGATIGENVLVGMNAVVMDRAVIGANSIIGALTFVPAGMEVPERKVVVGNPARIVKDASDEMIAWKTEGTRLYQELPARMHATLREVEPLHEPEADRPVQPTGYRTWMEQKGAGEGDDQPNGRP